MCQHKRHNDVPIINLYKQTMELINVSALVQHCRPVRSKTFLTFEFGSDDRCKGEGRELTGVQVPMAIMIMIFP